MRFSLHSVHGGVKDIKEIYNRAQRAEALGLEGICFWKSRKVLEKGASLRLLVEMTN